MLRYTWRQSIHKCCQCFDATLHLETVDPQVLSVLWCYVTLGDSRSTSAVSALILLYIALGDSRPTSTVSALILHDTWRQSTHKCCQGFDSTLHLETVDPQVLSVLWFYITLGDSQSTSVFFLSVLWFYMTLLKCCQGFDSTLHLETVNPQVLSVLWFYITFGDSRPTSATSALILHYTWRQCFDSTLPLEKVDPQVLSVLWFYM